MRSRLICSLVSVGMFVALPAQAETTRVRIAVDELPKQNEPFEVNAKTAVLPNGARDHSPIPKTWRKQPESGDEQIENSRCTDDRRGSVGTIYGTTTTTRKIWEADGKTWLDSADVELTWGYVDVKHADRVPLARITDGLWGYRSKNGVVLVSARDTGFIEEGGFYECRIQDTEIAAPSGTAGINSSPQEVNDTIHSMARSFAEPGKPPKWHPAWVGVEYRILASVSKSSTDTAPMLNLVIKKP